MQRKTEDEKLKKGKKKSVQITASLQFPDGFFLPKAAWLTMIIDIWMIQNQSKGDCNKPTTRWLHTAFPLASEVLLWQKSDWLSKCMHTCLNAYEIFSCKRQVLFHGETYVTIWKGTTQRALRHHRQMCPGQDREGLRSIAGILQKMVHLWWYLPAMQDEYLFPSSFCGNEESFYHHSMMGIS